MHSQLEAIEAEIEARALRPASPGAFARIASNGRWKSATHLAFLDAKLVALSEGRVKRLIVTMPPRHGKSELCSKYFPAWFVGTYPDRKIILCSYEANFAAEWGGKARDLIDEAGHLFGVQVRDDQRARDDWRIEGHEGGMKTAGVGGPITGKGCHVMIVDDPVKNAEEAASETYRDKAWEWWRSTAFTRLEPEASAMIVLTRWNEDDLAGRLIKQQDDGETDEEERWEVVNLPAIAEEDDDLDRAEGEPLWPERWPLARLKAISKTVGTVVWNALFQQRPTAPEGNYFKRAWFNIVEPDRVPSMSEMVRCWDLAATVEGEKGNSDPDWLAGCKMGVTEDRRYFIFHIERDRISPQGVRQRLHNTARMDGPSVRVRVEQEGAASGKIVAHEYSRLLDGFDCRFVTVPRASKYTRSGPFNAACERGDVFIVAGEWNQAFIDEMATFPNGKHDDQVDAAVGAYTALAGVEGMSAAAWEQIVSYPDERPASNRDRIRRLINNR